MITADGEKIKIEGTLGDAMSECEQIVKSITDIALGVIDMEEDPEEANELIKELSKWAANIIVAVMPDMNV